ncbi:hypothetical protein HDU90_006782 [Geranomyces variabilis]|nr:hypothetical protein HDU90_006782 [Geranomyces variabilis]
MLMMSKEKKTVKNDEIFAHKAETFATSIQAAVTQCMRGEESRKTKDLLSKFGKIVSTIVADKEKFGAFKATCSPNVANGELEISLDTLRVGVFSSPVVS